MSSPTKTYRVYCYDDVHKILSGDWLEAASDEEALAKAHAKGFCTQWEVWDGNRLVAQVGEKRRTG